MNKNKFARIIPIALTLIIAAVTIAALVSLVRFIFFPSSAVNNTKVDIGESSLLNTSVDMSVKFIVRGPIVANENFRSYQIKITPSNRTLTVFQGYLDQPIKTISLENNVPAYEQFVYALNKANMMKGVEAKGDNNDLRGVCASGSIYEYQTLKSEAIQKNLWTSSCAGSRGSLNANTSQLNSLFIAQIPNSKTIISDIWQ